MLRDPCSQIRRVCIQKLPSSPYRVKQEVWKRDTNGKTHCKKKKLTANETAGKREQERRKITGNTSDPGVDGTNGLRTEYVCLG